MLSLARRRALCRGCNTKQRRHDWPSFRERERLPNQPATALAQGVVEALDVVGLATLLANNSMALGWQMAA
jgi:hypothetical protein